MAQDNYGKGSIVYKILIVLLTAALVFSIYYPKKLWEEEARNTEVSHYRMSNIYNAALQYHRFHHQYTDSLEELIQFIKTDSSYHAYVDSMFSGPLDEVTAEFDSIKQVQVELDGFLQTISPLDTVAQDSLANRISEITYYVRRLRDKMQVIKDQLKAHPYAPTQTLDKAREVVERKDFFLQYEIIKNMITQNKLQKALAASNKIRNNYETIIGYLRQTKAQLSNIFTLADSMYVCPTTRKPYKVTVIDTSAIKVFIVESPITREDSLAVARSFLKSTVGALKLKNHGRIENGVTSWESAN